jgi:DNA-binding NarL/FixJ family response regulator
MSETKHPIALVDDHHLVRNGLATMINGHKGYAVVLEASNGKEFIDALDMERLPEIAIVDLNMPVMDGYATITWLKEYAPSVRPLALTFDASDDAMVRAVRCGARGFLLKNAPPELLRKALDSLILTGYYQSDDMHRTLMENPEMKTGDERQHQRILEKITPREMELLMLVCSEDELTYEEIAGEMGVHRRTVDNFRVSLFSKFNLKSKTGLVLFAMRHGLIK